MRPSEIVLVGLPAEALSVACQAAQLAFPGSALLLVDRWEQGLPTAPCAGARLLVLTDADSVAIASATQFADAGGVPRCAVVVLGRDSSELAETVPPDEWDPPLVARVFRSTLLQQELLCENLRLRGDLKTVARRISHDLRTSVGCIHTSAEILRDVDAAALAIAAAGIKQSSLEISQLVERVSFVLKASADPSPSAPVEMGQLVAGVLRRLAPEIAKAGASVTVQPASWPEVSGVARWLAVVWENLLTNAIRHGRPGNQISVEWRRDGDEYRFSVVDRGRGIDPERVAGLFPAFDRLHRAHRTGLGLSITQRLVALQRGRCGHEAPAEGGARFYFTLPARDSTPQNLRPL